MKNRSLSKEDKSRLKEELKHDSNKDFDSEFVRTTNLERKIIEDFGFEGIKLLFESKNSGHFYPLGNFPTDCPWVDINEKNVKEAIDEIFNRIKEKIPNLTTTIKNRTLFIYAEHKDQIWHLHYLMDSKLYDGRNYYRVYRGGEPLQQVGDNKNILTYGWKIPNDLKEFYSIHDGFGETHGAGLVLNSKDIAILGELMNPICKKQNIEPSDYSFNDLLEFFPDGAGNAQCFIRNEYGNNRTVDWDHETWELSGEVSFYDFIDKRLSEIDEE